MQKKHILKTLSLLAAVCITTGCNGSAASETTTATTTTTTVESMMTVTNTAETTMSSEGADSGISELAEAEIDYVDEFGYFYYKNPTIWTSEKIFEELTINEKKHDAPLTLEKLGQEFSYSIDGAFYDEDTRIACLRLMYNNKSIAWVYLEDCDSIEDISGKVYNRIQFDVNVTSEEFAKQIKICGIDLNSSKEELIKIIGMPAVSNGKYLHYINTEENPESYNNIKNEIMKFYISQETGNVAIISISL